MSWGFQKAAAYVALGASVVLAESVQPPDALPVVPGCGAVGSCYIVNLHESGMNNVKTPKGTKIEGGVVKYDPPSSPAGFSIYCEAKGDINFAKYAFAGKERADNGVAVNRFDHAWFDLPKTCDSMEFKAQFYTWTDTAQTACGEQVKFVLEPNCGCPSLPLKQCDVGGPKQENMWCVDSVGSGRIFSSFPAGDDNMKWGQIGGALKQVSVSKDGKHVWGVNIHDNIYYKNGLAGGWKHIPGKLKQIEVSDDGSKVWGVNSGNNVYTRDGLAGNWKHVSGIQLKWVSVGAANDVWGIDLREGIRYLEDGDWKQVPGHLSNIDVSDTGVVVGVNRHGQVYRRDGKNGRWGRLFGNGYSFVSAAGGDLVYAVNKKGEYGRLDNTAFKGALVQCPK